MMDTLSENPRAVIGANNPPPEMTPFDAVKINITDLYDEARLWLDGTPVETQEQADALNTLKARIKDAIRAAETQRVIEGTPHKQAIDEIQARYNELIGNNKSVTGIALKAEEACNKALKPYLLELDRQQQEAARIAREEAERKQREAMEAMRQRDAANLQQREDAERLVQEAKQADAAASQAEKAKAHAKGEGRATGLRTVYRAVMVDRQLAAKWVWLDRNEELMAWIQDQADKAVRGGVRSIAGFEVIEEKVL
ncbi:hypothetical protein HB770_21070 [Rhizobium leguminosarum bv. viciae]|uniref:Uncharacterized protein n=1 Tax=Rhizobium leguminosarum bv. viciae TaxID=387 RepID=A0A7G6RL63_RHILV|nr:hypothetical protein HB770_21070 [Rhizobium leguminosarum bv. viciae]